MQLDSASLVLLKKTNATSFEKIDKQLETKQVRFWRALMACHDVLYKHFETNLAEKNMSYSRFQLLFNIHYNPNCSAIFLAEKMNVTRGNISTFLKRMIQDELILEIFEKNKKRCSYELSKKGRQILTQTFDIHITEVINTIPNIKDETLLDLEKLSATLQK